MSWLSDLVRDVTVGLSEAALRQFGKKTEARPWIHPHYWRWYVDSFLDDDPACDTCGHRLSVSPPRCPGPKGWK